MLEMVGKRVRWLVLAVAAIVVVPACGGSGRAAGPTAERVVRVVAAENFWGNITEQLGGEHVKVRSIINDPSADPHLYESDAADAAAISGAQFVIENGLGYDDFFSKLLSSAGPKNKIVVADVLHVSGNDANPHLWYDVPHVGNVARAIADHLAEADPADRAFFETNLATFNTSVQPILRAVDDIKTRFPGAPVAYTERVAGYLLQAADLDVRSPNGFAQSIEDGNDPSANDMSEMESLLHDHKVKVLLYNRQATSPLTQHIQDVAQGAGVPVVGVTETLPPNERTYQDWQLHQIEALSAALSR